MSNHPKRQAALIFIIIGEIIRHLRWLGYVSAALGIALFLIALYDIFTKPEQIFRKAIVSLEYMLGWTFFSLGFVRFAGKLGEAIREAKRSAIIGILVIAVLASIFVALFATLYHGWGKETAFRTAAGILVVLATFIFVLTLSLIVYWKDLKGGLEIYEE
jgi:hypothetical protein